MMIPSDEIQIVANINADLRAYLELGCVLLENGNVEELADCWEQNAEPKAVSKPAPIAAAKNKVGPKPIMAQL
jgi:hypothetical protein